MVKLYQICLLVLIALVSTNEKARCGRHTFIAIFPSSYEGVQYETNTAYLSHSPQFNYPQNMQFLFKAKVQNFDHIKELIKRDIAYTATAVMCLDNIKEGFVYNYEL